MNDKLRNIREKTQSEPACSSTKPTWSPIEALPNSTITVAELTYLHRTVPQPSINLVLRLYISQVYPTFAMASTMYLRFVPKPFMRVETRQCLKSNIPIAHITCMGDHHVKLAALLVLCRCQPASSTSSGKGARYQHRSCLNMTLSNQEAWAQA